MNDLESKIGINKLNESERKKLFEKFVKAGGQVVKEKKKHYLNFDRERQKQLIKKLEKRSSPSNSKSSIKKEVESTLEARRKNLRKKNKGGLFTLYLKGLFQGIITLSGQNISKRFFKFLKYEAMPVLDRLDIIINVIISSKSELLEKIIEELDKMGEEYTDVFENMIQFYNEEEFNGILYFYENPQYKKVPLKLIEKPVKKIFKKLYILKDYLNLIYPSLKTALIITAREKRWDKKILTDRVLKARIGVDLITKQLLPKLYTLTLLYIKRNVPIHSKIIEKYLGITREDKIGYHKIEEVINKNKKDFSEYFTSTADVTQKKNENVLIKSFKDLTEEDIDKLDIEENIANGFKLMKKIDINSIQEFDINNTSINNLAPNDKILELFILLKEFEKEYSFILTSHRIIIKPIYENNKRVDYKDKMNLLYSQLSDLYELINEYADIVKSLIEIENDNMMNPLNKYNRLTAMEGRRSKLGFEIRKNAKKYFGEVYSVFTRLITDYETQKRIIENPEDILNFNVEIEGEKKLQGKKIIEALKSASDYLSAILYRLEDGGDLSGLTLELKEHKWELKEEVENKNSSDILSSENNEKDFFDEITEALSKKNNNESNRS